MEPLGTIRRARNRSINILDTSPPRGNAFVTPADSLFFYLPLFSTFFPWKFDTILRSRRAPWIAISLFFVSLMTWVAPKVHRVSSLAMYERRDLHAWRVSVEASKTTLWPFYTVRLSFSCIKQILPYTITLYKCATPKIQSFFTLLHSLKYYFISF